jgi:inner membrane protein
MRGINKEINMQFGGKSYELNPGIPVKDIVASGVSCKPEITGNKEFEFSFTLDINGSQSLNFLPVGKNTNVSLHSSWSNPSFSGSYLPDNREIGPDGFSADWNILHLNRNYPQQWTGSSYSIGESAFGLNLLFPVDQYQKSNRAVKYAIMFIALTFISFFFSETLRKIRIHPMQYLLVGFALIIFFSLLISLSEYVGFGYAYLISGSMIVAMITLYYYSLVKNIRATAIISLIMVTLYLFLFTILQLQDYSLIMGSIGLFVILAVVMFLSRKIDWYAPLNRQGE